MSHRRHRTGISTGELKYARGAGPRVPPSQRPLGILEVITLAHVAVLIIATTWAFGGEAEWMTAPLAWWGSLGILITLTAVQDRDAWREGWMRPVYWMWPIIAFNALVLLASLNPTMREVKVATESVFLYEEGGRTGLPGSARPALALRALWLFDAIWIACFNLVLVVRQRRSLRLLLLIAVTNAGALALFGGVQKLAQARSPFFSAEPTLHERFFATFLHPDHWGAFVVLMLAACLGLVWHYGRRREARDFFPTPASAGVSLLLLLALTVPLSGSRPGTILAIALLGAALLHGTARLAQRRRSFNESMAPPVLGAVMAGVVTIAAIWFVARDAGAVRNATAEEPPAVTQPGGGSGTRAGLQRNAWRMAQDRPWFGWGMASYPHVLPRYNPAQPPDPAPASNPGAPGGWLQAVAEHGLVGSTLLGLCAIVPLLRLRRRHFSSPMPVYLLSGCTLLVLHAWFGSPFANIAVVLCWWMCFFSSVQYARLQDRETVVTEKGASSAALRGAAPPRQ